MAYPLHFNLFMLVSGLPLMANGGCKGKSHTIERVMLIGFILCAGVIPFCICLGGGGYSNLGGSCIESERRALLAIRADIYDPDEWLSSWTGQDCCQWWGVGCNNATGHVVKLNLRYPYDIIDMVEGTAKFPGPSKVNPSLSSLIHLRYLDLSMNNFSGASIPEFIGSLIHLEYLNLSLAEFGGPIARVIGNLSSLHSLDLNSGFEFDDGGFYDTGGYRVNDLQWLSGITSLRYLDLSFTSLSKASNWLHEINMHPSLLVLRLLKTELPGIPSTLQYVNLTSLAILDLSYNAFESHAISHWLLNISSLVELHLGGCEFHGRLSVLVDMLGNFNSLKYLDLSGSQITGHAAEILGNLSQLMYLYLDDNQISGEIPASLGSMLNLAELSLSYNQISGWIPEVIGNLVHLRQLDLSSNNIIGQIPKNISKLCNLRELSLSYNQINGWIPEVIGNLVHLRLLDLSSNNITGQIPKNISKLCNLQELYLSYNNINGEITGLIEGFSKSINNKLDGRSCLQSLAYIEMRNNNLSGMIPESLGQLSALERLDVSLNSFTGYLTEGHFSNLTRLYDLDLSYNSLKMILSNSWIPPFNALSIMMCSCYVGAKFPSWLRTQIHLGQLCLSEAGISDKIPSWLWHRDMSTLNLSYNCIQGQLPSSRRRYFYGNVLDLSSNYFTGPIPNLNFDFILLSNNSFSGLIFSYNFGDFNPAVLSLSDNHINGSIPQSLCNLTSLEVLDLSNNELTGGFPDCWSKSQLGRFDVPKNKSVEDSFSTMAHTMKLQSLHMRNNNLSGQFPSFLRLCKGLVVLDLGENRFSGNIPTWIGENLLSLRVLRLRSNFFDGNVPVQISCLSSLQVLDLACNNFSGDLPSSFGNFTSMVEKQEGRELWFSEDMATFYYKESLLLVTKGITLMYTSVLLLVTSIDLSNNNLSGKIPNEVTTLYELHYLNLSENHFTGKIPQNIGDMKQLESLDLSMNNLSGQIPQTIAALNFLSHLNLSYNNLSGRIPSGYQIQTFDDTSIYAGNYNLCGQPLPECPKNAPPHQEEEQADEDSYEMIWVYATSALGFVMGFWGFIGMVMIKKDIRISYLQFIDKIYDWIYVQLAIKFAKLKSIRGAGNHKH